jgi:hypothetical protein
LLDAHGDTDADAHLDAGAHGHADADRNAHTSADSNTVTDSVAHPIADALCHSDRRHTITYSNRKPDAHCDADSRSRLLCLNCGKRLRYWRESKPCMENRRQGGVDSIKPNSWAIRIFQVRGYLG